MRKIIIFVVIIITLLGLNINAQLLNEAYTSQMPQIIPSSPQSKIFEKYINHKITEYNGLPETNIPLYNIEIKGLTIPIALSYHASGVKYKQFDGDIGAGWSINASGYRVSRTVYGKADEKYDMCNPSLLNSLSNSEDRDSFLASVLPSLNNSFSLTVANGKYVEQDGEYDQFYFMLPSVNGNFIISNRNNKSVTILDKSLEKIILDEKETKLYLDDIKIIDDAGFTYYMGKEPDGQLLAEYTTSTPAISMYNKMAWPVKRIMSPYGEIIDFKYSLHNVPQTDYPSYRITGAALDDYTFRSSQFSKSTYATGGYVDEKSPYKEMLYLDEITTKKETVKFIRINTGDYPYLLKEIQVIDKSSNIIKVIKLEQKVFPENTNYNSNTKWNHHLLTSVSIGTNRDKNEVYRFKYYEAPQYPSPDIWGYYLNNVYSGRETNPLFLDNELKQETIINEINYFQTVPVKIDRIFLENYYNLKGIAWLNRSENKLTPNYFSLHKIIFPTGGVTEYQYEPNQFPDGKYGNGQRIKRIISYTNNESKKDFIITEFKYGINEKGFGKADILLTKDHFVNETLGVSYFGFPNIGDGKPQLMLSRNQNLSFSINPSISDLPSTNIKYEQVATYNININDSTKNTKVISTFNIPGTYEGKYAEFHSRIKSGQNINGVSILDGSILLPNSRGGILVGKYLLGYKPNIKNIKIYDNKNNLVKEEQYEYLRTTSESFNNLKVIQRISSDEKSILNHYANDHAFYKCFTSFFDYMNYSIHTGKELLSSKKTITYDEGGKIIDSESYTYNTKYQLKTTTKTNSLSGVLTKEYTYPTLGNELEKKNMVSTVIKTKTVHNDKEIGIVETVYPNNSILPDYVRTSTGNNVFRNDIVYDKYDDYGNLVQYTTLDGLSTTLLWGYSSFYPIAEIKNAKYSDITPIINDATLSSLSDKALISESDSLLINNLRINNLLEKAQISTYTYKPLVGMISAMNPTGLKTLYSYDIFGRLKEVRDHDNKLISTYYYNYNIYMDGDEEGLFIKHNSLHSSNYENNPLYIPGSSASFELVSSDNKKTYTHNWSLLSLDTFSEIPINAASNKTISIPLTKKGNMKLSCISKDLATGDKIESVSYFEVADLPLKLEIPIMNSYYEDTYYNFDVLVQGGSGNFLYNWTLKDISGNLIESSTLKNPNIYIPLNKRGKLTITCIVKDVDTGKNSQINKTLDITYKPILINVNTPQSCGVNKSFPLSVNVKGGSGNFSYNWTIIDDKGKILASSTNANPSFTISEVGTKTLTCTVKDIVTEKVESLSKELNIKYLIEFKNIKTSMMADTKTMTFEIHNPTSKSVTIDVISFVLTPYFNNKRAQASYSFNNSITTYLDYSKDVERIIIPNGVSQAKITLYSEDKSRAMLNVFFSQLKEYPYSDIMLESTSLTLTIE